MDVALFDYDLPPELIAQEPAEPRDASRLLVVDRARGTREDRQFRDLPLHLRPGDCVVANESRVMPARLLGALEPGGRAVELLMLGPAAEGRWRALVRPGRRCRPGAVVSVGDGRARVRVVAEQDEGVREVAIEAPWSVAELLDRHGMPPLPPYIARHDAPKPDDRERYQTVYAREPGSVAAPTAGLHFTPELVERVRALGAEMYFLTLHVGVGTFRPLRASQVEAHRIAPELVDIPQATADAVNRARGAGRRIVAIGTTTTRALEWAVDGSGRVRSGCGAADLYIVPGHRFRAVDALVTNFHLPRSTLLVLVAAFCGREAILDAYRHAVEARYRFYSYGDAMLIA
jgi:S-adenosylmethionine:tRNA ribosyltransferase-isomerase